MGRARPLLAQLAIAHSGSGTFFKQRAPGCHCGRLARKSEIPAGETLPDLVADALAARDLDRAISLLENERERGLSSGSQLLLLTYLYCLTGNVEKGQALIVANVGAIKRDWTVDWLWKKLHADFGFQPPH